MIKRLLEKIKSSSFVVSVLKVGSGQLIAQCLSLISVPILSRIYSETAYGDTALIVSTAGLLVSCCTLGLNMAIMQPKEDEEAKAVFTTVTVVGITLCTVFTLGCYALISVTKLFDVSSHYGWALLLMWIYAVVNMMNSFATAYCNRRGKYNTLFFNPIIGAGLNFLLAIPLGLLGFGYMGFMLTNIVQYGVCSLHMMRGDNPFKKDFKLKEIRRVLVQYKDYVLFQCPSALVGNFGIEYPTQFFGRVFTTQELGGYSMCDRLLKYPIRLIASPIATVYFRTATEYHREGKNLAEFTYKIITRILLISALPVAVFILISEPLVVFVLGSEWKEAGELAGFLIVQYVLLLCSQTTSYCRVSIGKQKTNLFVSLVCLAVGVLSCGAGYWLFGEMTAALFVYSLGQCLYNMYDMAVNFYCMDKRYMFRYLAVTIIYVLIMFGVYFLSRTWIK